MSITYSVEGVVPADAEFNKMEAVYDACRTAGVSIPSEVDNFFNGEKPDPSGVIVEVDYDDWDDEYRCGFEVDISKLPSHVKLIRFTMSY